MPKRLPAGENRECKPLHTTFGLVYMDSTGPRRSGRRCDEGFPVKVLLAPYREILPLRMETQLQPLGEEKWGCSQSNDCLR